MERQSLPLYSLLEQWEGGHDPEISRHFRMLSVHWRHVAAFLTWAEVSVREVQISEKEAIIDWLDRADVVLTYLNNLVGKPSRASRTQASC